MVKKFGMLCLILFLQGIFWSGSFCTGKMDCCGPQTSAAISCCVSNGQGTANNTPQVRPEASTITIDFSPTSIALASEQFPVSSLQGGIHFNDHAPPLFITKSALLV
ncbi:MAG: hypothetical protein HYS22_02515 [Deltaproteobacteria bacterium]|nr:hypothetical protein [Deltaproteobacteria bacterium]